MVWLIFVIPLVLVLIYAVYHDYKKKPFSADRNPSENEDYGYAHSMADRSRHSDNGGGSGF